MSNHKWKIWPLVCAVIVLTSSTSQAITTTSLAQLRSLSAGAVSDLTITLSPTGGDPHPVTGVVTPGHYWLDADDAIFPGVDADNFKSMLHLDGSNNVYEFAGTQINLDTRELPGHGRGFAVTSIGGSNNTLQNLDLRGHDLALDTDPNAQRYQDGDGQYLRISGSNTYVNGANVVTRGSNPYGFGDAFGKGARPSNGNDPPEQGGVPFLGHDKMSGVIVRHATDVVVNNLTLEVNAYGHGFFMQLAEDTTLTNSTVTGQLFPSQNAIDHPLYQEYGIGTYGNPIPDDILISGGEDGVRLYTNASGFTADNVEVRNMRSGFAVAPGGGTKTLSNVRAFGTEQAFGVSSNTTITNAQADSVNGPILNVPFNNVSNSSVEVELVGDAPVNHDWALAHIAGNNFDFSLSSDLTPEELAGTSLVRFGEFWFDNWREASDNVSYEVAGFDHTNSSFTNNTNQPVVFGDQVTGNTGSSQGPVVTNGKDNDYDGISLVPTGKRTVVVHVDGLGNNGTAADGSLETNASIVQLGGTLELATGIRISNEKLTISGDGVDGNGALYTSGTGVRFGSSSGSDESTIFLDGDASIGVDGDLLVGSVQGVGNLTKLGVGRLSLESSNTFDGDLIVAEGDVNVRGNGVRHGLVVSAGASIKPLSDNGYNTDGHAEIDGTLDLNGRSNVTTLTQRIGSLSGSGSVISSNSATGASGVLEILGDSGESTFLGQITGDVSLVKSGSNTQTLGGSMTYTGSTSITDGTLLVNGAHTGGDSYMVAGGVLGGNGSSDADITVESGGTIAPGASAGQLMVKQIVFETGSTLEIEIGGLSAGTEYDQLMADSVTLSGDLTVSLLDLGNGIFLPDPSDSFSVLDATTLSGMFDNVANGTRLDTTGGEGSFLVTYDSTSDVVMLSGFLASASAGDFDGEGDVDGSDFLTWQRDPNAGNLADWQTYYGSPLVARAAVTPVPAPGTMWLLGIGLATCRMFRRLV